MHFSADLALFSQNAVQDELTKRGFSPDAGQSSGTISIPSNAHTWCYTDPVMAEYITIMIINNKTAGTSMLLLTALVRSVLTLSVTTAQITSELEDCKHYLPF